MTASPNQLVARTNTREIEEGLNATHFQDNRSHVRQFARSPSLRTAYPRLPRLQVSGNPPQRASPINFA